MVTTCEVTCEVAKRRIYNELHHAPTRISRLVFLATGCQWPTDCWALWGGRGHRWRARAQPAGRQLAPGVRSVWPHRWQVCSGLCLKTAVSAAGLAAAHRSSLCWPFASMLEALQLALWPPTRYIGFVIVDLAHGLRHVPLTHIWLRSWPVNSHWSPGNPCEVCGMQR